MTKKALAFIPGRTRASLVLPGLLALAFALPARAQITLYESNADDWLLAAPGAEIFVFDACFPGIVDDTGCLGGPPGPTVQMAGGVVTVSGFDALGLPGCAIIDGSTAPAVSDGWIASGGMLVMEFDPPVTAFYTFYGSLAFNESGVMSVFADGSLIDSFSSFSNVDLNGVLAVGFGFTSTVPIDRIELTATDPGGVVAGAFVGLAPDNPSLGSISIAGYRGPTGPTVLVDFACVFEGSSAVFGETECGAVEDTFTVQFPKLGFPPDEEGQGWTRPQVWAGHPGASDDSITVPNGRPIYALIVSGYESNKYLDELMVYKFARHLMAQGAYVHYAWWNNLLAPYMERPLHYDQSDPGSLFGNSFNFPNPKLAENKAVPGEDYQFVADAKLFLTAIRAHNPNAIIVVVGHSMGGGAVVHLVSQTDVVIDILAPIDPVGNRNYPWGRGPLIGSFDRDFNWTRWRVSRDNFLGYRSQDWNLAQGCHPVGPWLRSLGEASNHILCAFAPYTSHDAPRVIFGNNVINLHHRYQHEFLFPFDFGALEHFGHSRPPGGSTSQEAVPMTPAFCGFAQRCRDPGGWPVLTPASFACCPTGPGVGWNLDGHGEIVGYRGDGPPPIPLGVRLRTSRQCGQCPNQKWSGRSYTLLGGWSNGAGTARRQALQDLENLPFRKPWEHRPTNPDLCKVYQGLIDLFGTMNRPPTANAGEDQVVEPDTEVTLDGSGSSDPDDDALTYTWAWPGWCATGPVVTVILPTGTHCITLTVQDPNGHIDHDVVEIRVGSCAAADLNGDCVVDGADLGILLGSWGLCLKPCPPGCPADFNGDCDVGGADLGLLLGQWTP